MTPSEVFPPGSKVVAYLRDSGGQQQDFSIRQQKSALEKWALQNHVEITLFYIDEARTGTTTTGRHAFQNMINHFRQPLIQEVGLVLYSYSRFSRDINSAWRYKGEIRGMGYKILSITDNIPDDENVGPVVEFLTDWSNASHSKRDTIEATRGLHYNMDEFGCIGGVPPKGFRREQLLIGQHRGGGKRYASKWIPDPDLWDICKLAWQMRIEGKSYREINSVCKLFKDTNSYVTFFKNKIYYGDIVYGGKTYKNYVEPMIDFESWQRVQTMYSPRNNPKIKEQHPRRANSSFLLSGLVYCSRCGSILNGNVVKHRANGEVYGYYFCSKAENRDDCDALRISKESLESAVFEKVQEYVLDPRLVYERQRAYLAEKMSSSDEKQILIRELRKRITEQKTKMGNLLAALELSDPQDMPSLTKRIRERDSELRDLANQLAELLSEQRESLYTVSPAEASRKAADIASRLVGADSAELKQMLTGLIKTIEAEKDVSLIRGSITFYPPPSDYNIPPTNGDVEPDGNGDDLCLPLKSPRGRLLFKA